MESRPIVIFPIVIVNPVSICFGSMSVDAIAPVVDAVPEAAVVDTLAR
jgi:hypothetical protein